MILSDRDFLIKTLLFLFPFYLKQQSSFLMTNFIRFISSFQLYFFIISFYYINLFFFCCLKILLVNIQFTVVNIKEDFLTKFLENLSIFLEKRCQMITYPKISNSGLLRVDEDFAGLVSMDVTRR